MCAEGREGCVCTRLLLLEDLNLRKEELVKDRRVSREKQK